tara:strand:- start:141 stop:371 length:231 start_codon:yes stop_codon:yes gene_type:complete
MSKVNNEKNIFESLAKGVEEGEPNISYRIKEILKSSEDPSEMRYLEGLLMMLGESLGELEDPPDFENDQEEYWEEY